MTTNDATTHVFPISVSYVVSEELAAESEAAMKEVFMPLWLQIAIPVAVFLQMLTQLPKLLADGSPALVFKVLAFIVVFYAFMFWRNARNKRLARAAIVGKDVSVQFRADGFGFSIGQKTDSLRYSSIVRAGRDERGLVLVIEKLGGLWIPTRAFSSTEQRDFVFRYLGRFMKKS